MKIGKKRGTLRPEVPENLFMVELAKNIIIILFGDFDKIYFCSVIRDIRTQTDTWTHTQTL